jgi:hypothetical protein
MTERITLEVSDRMVRRARTVSQQTNRPVEMVLADWLERTSEAADISPLDAHAAYQTSTVFGAEATAQTLLALLAAPTS